MSGCGVGCLGIILLSTLISLVQQYICMNVTIKKKQKKKTLATITMGAETYVCVLWLV